MHTENRNKITKKLKQSNKNLTAMKTNQKDLYTTAKQMNVDTPYVCGWMPFDDSLYGWQLVRMRDNAILRHIGSAEKGQLGVLHALNHLKAEMFDMGINKNQVTFI